MLRTQKSVFKAALSLLTTPPIPHTATGCDVPPPRLGPRGAPYPYVEKVLPPEVGLSEEEAQGPWGPDGVTPPWGSGVHGNRKRNTPWPLARPPKSMGFSPPLGHGCRPPASRRGGASGNPFPSAGSESHRCRGQKATGRTATPLQSHPHLVIAHFTHGNVTEIISGTGSLRRGCRRGPLPRGAGGAAAERAAARSQQELNEARLTTQASGNPRPAPQ